MKKISFTILILLFTIKTFAQKEGQNVVTYDIDNFWTAYDKIAATKDSAQQYNYLNTLFIEKGSPGLKAIMEVKKYTPKSYIDAINSYPEFWNSVRPNTLKAKGFARDIITNIEKFKKLYPELKPAQIYFTIGALRTGGTTQGDKVLIGTEVALGDKNTVTTELKGFDNLRTYFDSDPAKITVFTNVHEYVHTQQKTNDANTLLAQCVMEGVAEFVASRVSGPSTLTALSYGRANDEKIQQKFITQAFNGFNGFWLYSNAENEFGFRDLGYYVGYAICEKYYDKATDKKLAIKQMIELDYDNEADLSKFVDASGYFAAPVKTLKEKYEAGRPVVTGIGPFKNNADGVSPTTNLITVEFSAPMNKSNRNFDMGPLGKDNILRLKSFKGFSEDGRSMIFEVEMKPALHYQLVIGNGFRSQDGISLKPYLIDFKTSDH